MMRTTKVLQVLARSTGGIAGHVADVTEALGGRDGLAIDIAGPPELSLRMPVPLVPIDIPDGVRGHLSATGQLHRVISEGGYDVVHSHGLRAAIDGGRAARTTPATSIATIHNLVLPEISGGVQAALFRRVEPLAVRWNDHVFAPSEDIARRLRSAIPRHADKVEVLHLGVRRALTTLRGRNEAWEDLGLTPEHQLLVTVARLAPQKSLDVLLKAVTYLPSTVHLAIVGSGPLENELKEIASSFGLDQRVRFLGYRTSPQDFIADADLFCLSSVWEACSLAAQEAMALGVPVVSTDVGGMPELIQDRVSGRLVPQGNAQALASTIKELLGDPQERRRLAQNAFAHLEVHFSREKMLKRLAAAYRGEAIATA